MDYKAGGIGGLPTISPTEPVRSRRSDVSATPAQEADKLALLIAKATRSS